VLVESSVAVAMQSRPVPRERRDRHACAESADMRPERDAVSRCRARELWWFGEEWRLVDAHEGTAASLRPVRVTDTVTRTQRTVGSATRSDRAICGRSTRGVPRHLTWQAGPGPPAPVSAEAGGARRQWHLACFPLKQEAGSEPCCQSASTVRRPTSRKNTMTATSWILIVLLAVAVLYLAGAIRIIYEYQRAVVFTLGRFKRVKGPGLILVFPWVQKEARVDLRTVVLDVPTQDLISRDNVSIHVNAVIYFKVVDPERAIIQVERYEYAISQLAQTTLRSNLGKHDLDEMLVARDKLNRDIQEILAAQTTDWGIKVDNVEIKHIDIEGDMIRAIARQAEAERDRRARVINAEGEQQAAQKLLEAAEILSMRPEAMQLRYLGTLGTNIASDKSSTIVFPFPVEFGRFYDVFARRSDERGRREHEDVGVLGSDGDGRQPGVREH
jgi:regulator of protease activity HflC (stomatin/prohibitin superfamily)